MTVRRARRAICAAIGSSMPCRAPSASAAPVVRTPSATMCMSTRICDRRRPLPSSRPTCRLRLKSPVHVDHEIAEPAQAGERVAPCALRAGEARDLGQPTRDERSHGVVPESEPFHHAGGNRDHVLHAPRQSPRPRHRRSRRDGDRGHETVPAHARQRAGQTTRPAPRPAAHARPPSRNSARTARRSGNRAPVPPR